MTDIFRGTVSKAYVEIDPPTQHCIRVCLFLDEAGWIEFTGIVLKDGFLLPAPLGCACLVTDISARHWGNANYEVTFASSYSREGIFYAKHVAEITAI